MNKRDKALIKLFGLLTTEIVVIAANLAFSNADKQAIGARKANIVRDISRVMKENVDKIEELVKEATNDEQA